MKEPYSICFPTFIQIVYLRDKVYYINNGNANYDNKSKKTYRLGICTI
jgi:hypothetical protein